MKLQTNKQTSVIKSSIHDRGFFSIVDRIKQAIWQAWEKTAKDNGWPVDLIKPDDIKLEHPAEEKFGDYSTNVAMIVFGKLRSTIVGSFLPRRQAGDRGSKIPLNPLELAEKIVDNLKNNETIEQLSHAVSAVSPAFINLTINNDYLVDQLYEAINQGDKYWKTDLLGGKKIMVEFAHPNTHKAFHIGHLRNISTGEFIVRILEANGAKVIRTNYQGDVGLHIAKCLWGLITKQKTKNKKPKTLRGKIDLLAKAYVAGSKAYDEDTKAKEEVKDINYLIYAAAQKYQQKEHKIQPGSTDYLKFVKGTNIKLDKIYDLWVQTRQWSLEHFEEIYKRADSHFDRKYFESECLAGIDNCQEALKKRILSPGKDGTIIFNGEPYGLHTRVFVNSLGLPTYEGKELALAPKELSEFGQLDKILHVVTPEQASFFAVTFKVEELLGWQKDQQYHLVYEWVKLKAGKMASRLGNVILGEWLLDEAKKRIIKSFPEVDKNTAEEIAVGAVKYSFLKQGIHTPINFDIDESVSLDGNSGPYLQYTFARTQSVLAKAKSLKLKAQSHPFRPNNEELSVLRWIYRFPETVKQAVQEYAPNVICIYLYELAQRFNTFYNKHRILEAKSLKLKAQSQTTDFRLVLTAATAQTLKNGLYLLGIKAPRRM